MGVSNRGDTDMTNSLVSKVLFEALYLVVTVAFLTGVALVTLTGCQLLAATIYGSRVLHNILKVTLYSNQIRLSQIA